MTATIKARYVKNQINAGHTTFPTLDQKGRSTGYRWTITSVTVEEVTSPDVWYHCHKVGDPMTFFEVWGQPTRDLKGYGPAFGRSHPLATIEEANKLVAKRIAAAQKRDTKKFKVA